MIRSADISPLPPESLQLRTGIFGWLLTLLRLSACSHIVDERYHATSKSHLRQNECSGHGEHQCFREQNPAKNTPRDNSIIQFRGQATKMQNSGSPGLVIPYEMQNSPA